MTRSFGDRKRHTDTHDVSSKVFHDAQRAIKNIVLILEQRWNKLKWLVQDRLSGGNFHVFILYRELGGGKDARDVIGIQSSQS